MIARRQWGLALLGLVLAAPCAAAAPLYAQGSCSSPPPTASPTASERWAPPLDRTVSLSLRDVSLRDALARLSAAARVRLSYSADLLPLDQRVCRVRASAPVGEILSDLLKGTPVEPVVAGPDRVVLAPVPEPTIARADTGTWTPATVLERVVVTGTPSGGPERALTVALNVIGRAQLDAAGSGTLSRTLDASVPGLWLWNQSPTSLIARYGSMRGASSFGLTYPKVYIDGIEVANPLLVSRLMPEAVERIEVIRGPQGAALYGTDAISGVINIVTRHESVDTGAPRVRFRSGIGISRSDFVAQSAVDQDHELSIRAGSTARSLGLDLGYGSAGEFIPNASSRRFTGSGSGRLVGRRTITSLTARFDAERAGVPVSPLLGPVLAADSGATTPASSLQSVRQYTVGLTSTFAQNDRWTHSLVVGIDGDRLQGVPDERLPVPFGADSAARISNGSADRATFRLSSSARFGTETGASGVLTLAAEHSILRERTLESELVEPQPQSGSGMGAGSATGEPLTASEPVVSWRHDSGIVAQGSASLRERYYLTGGLRLERNTGLSTADEVNLLPMLGAAVVFGNRDVTVKLRSAYGRGIRPTEIPARDATWPGFHNQARALSLGPESQSGIETGVDLVLARVVTLQATRFDQQATGLIQRVAVRPLPAPNDAEHKGTQHPPRQMMYALQNVGEIGNHGWELQGSASLGQLALSGTLSLVDSRVRRVAAGYTGDLRVGDRMLEVPARTASLTANWNARGWSASLTAYRASDWINYDRLAIAEAAAASTNPANELYGAALRSFWRTYPGVTHLSLTGTRDLTRRVSVVLTGDNLLDVQRGEPDDITVLPGRTLTLGVRAGF